MTAFLAPLQELAEELDVYIIMIHHQGHAGRDTPVSAGRGASSIAAVAQANWLLKKADGNPRQRTLHVEGNAVLETRLAFEVAGEENEPGEILYWKPVKPLDVFDVTELLRDGQEINTTELARRIQSPPPEAGKGPSRSAKNKAAQLRNEWEKAKRIKVWKGDNNSLMMRRIDLAE